MTTPAIANETLALSWASVERHDAADHEVLTRPVEQRAQRDPSADARQAENAGDGSRRGAAHSLVHQGGGKMQRESRSREADDQAGQREPDESEREEHPAQRHLWPGRLGMFRLGLIGFGPRCGTPVEEEQQRQQQGRQGPDRAQDEPGGAPADRVDHQPRRQRTQHGGEAHAAERDRDRQAAVVLESGGNHRNPNRRSDQCADQRDHAPQSDPHRDAGGGEAESGDGEAGEDNAGSTSSRALVLSTRRPINGPATKPSSSDIE
jgi:hypothetical protein